MLPLWAHRNESSIPNSPTCFFFCGFQVFGSWNFGTQVVLEADLRGKSWTPAGEAGKPEAPEALKEGAPGGKWGVEGGGCGGLAALKVLRL